MREEDEQRCSIGLLSEALAREDASESWRYDRLWEALETQADHSLEDSTALQRDYKSLMAVQAVQKIPDDISGPAVDIQFESLQAGSISDITGSDVTLRALAIRARSSAPTEEDHISGIVESIDLRIPSITIRPTDGQLIELTVGDDVGG